MGQNITISLFLLEIYKFLNQNIDDWWDIYGIRKENMEITLKNMEINGILTLMNCYL